MADRNLSLVLTAAGTVGSSLPSSMKTAGQAVAQLEGQSMALRTELAKQEGITKSAGRGTAEYAAALERASEIKTNLGEVGKQLAEAKVQQRGLTSNFAAGRAQMLKLAAAGAVVGGIIGVMSFRILRAADTLRDLRLQSSTTGISVGDLTRTLGTNTAALFGNRDAAVSGSRGQADFIENLKLMAVGIGEVDVALAARAGLKPYELANQSASQIGKTITAHIRLLEKEGKSTELAAVKRLVGAEAYAAYYAAAQLTEGQTKRIDAATAALARTQEGQKAVLQELGVEWGINKLAIEGAGLSLNAIFAPALGRALSLVTKGTNALTAFSQAGERNAGVVRIGGYALLALGGALSVAIAGGLLLRTTMFALTGQTHLTALATGGLTAAKWLLNTAVLVSTQGFWLSVAAQAASRTAMVVGAVATGAMTAAQWALNIAMTANPVGIVIAAVAGLAVGLVVLYNKSEKFRNIIQAGWRLLKKFWPVLLGPVGIAIKGFQLLYSRSEKFRNILARIAEAAKKVGQFISKIPGLGGGNGGPATGTEDPVGAAAARVQVAQAAVNSAQPGTEEHRRAAAGLLSAETRAAAQSGGNGGPATGVDDLQPPKYPRPAVPAVAGGAGGSAAGGFDGFSPGDFGNGAGLAGGTTINYDITIEGVGDLETLADLVVRRINEANASATAARG